MYHRNIRKGIWRQKILYLRRKCRKFPWKLAYSTQLAAPGQLRVGSVPSLNKRCFITVSSSLGKLGVREQEQGREYSLVEERLTTSVSDVFILTRTHISRRQWTYWFNYGYHTRPVDKQAVLSTKIYTWLSTTSTLGISNSGTSWIKLRTVESAAYAFSVQWLTLPPLINICFSI